MELRVAVFEPVDDRHRVLDARLTHGHRLEAALQGGVLLDGAVLLERGCADHVQVAAGQPRFEDVAGVHRVRFAVAPGTDEGVEFVDEDDHVSVVRNLVQSSGQALLEVTAVAGAGEHSGHVEGDDAFALQLLGHVT